MILEIGATYRTREGYDVLLTGIAEIPWRYNGALRMWRGWTGIFLDDGSPATWNMDGRWSATRQPWDVGGHDNDLVGRVG